MSEQTPTQTSSPNSQGSGLLKTIILIVVLFLIVLQVKSCYRNHQEEKRVAEAEAKAYALAHPPAPVVMPEFPTHGEGHATKEIGLKCWLDPARTYVRPSKAARYVFVEDTDVFFEDIGPGIGTNKEAWEKMPPGKYLVYPLKGDRIYFRWWQ